MFLPNRQLKRRLFHGIAILFVLYTAIDLANPQLCSDERGFLSARTAVQLLRNDITSAATSAAQSDLKNSTNDEVPDQPVHEEDCFCCCAHVIPMGIFDSNLVAQIRPELSIPTHIRIPFPLPENHFHPPRIA